MSNHWFDRFKSRYDISVRRPTNAAQKQSETLRTSIQQFHRYLRRTATVKATELKGVQEGIVGPWELRDIANMDQTPLQFCFNTKGASYAEKGEKSVSTRTTSGGHDKGQCTVQLTIFADGEPRIKPLLIFKGTEQRIPDREKMQHDPRVVVQFQENAWCNEEMIVFWLRNMGKKPNMFGQPRDRLLTYDAHRAQTTERVKTILTQECQTTLGLVPPGATSKVQLLDVTFNAQFKKSVDRPGLFARKWRFTSLRALAIKKKLLVFNVHALITHEVLPNTILLIDFQQLHKLPLKIHNHVIVIWNEILETEDF